MMAKINMKNFFFPVPPHVLSDFVVPPPPLTSANYPDHGHHGRLPLSRKNAHGRAGNGTRDVMVSSQEL